MSSTSETAPGSADVDDIRATLISFFANARDLPNGLSHDRFRCLLGYLDGFDEDAVENVILVCDAEKNGYIDHEKFVVWLYEDGVDAERFAGEAASLAGCCVVSEINGHAHDCVIVEASAGRVRIHYNGFDTWILKGGGEKEQSKFDEWLAADSHRLMPKGCQQSCSPVAVLPNTTADESKFLGARIAYLKTEFLSEVRRLFQADTQGDPTRSDPTETHYYDINPKLFFGPNGKGYGIKCPRDSREHSSYVDALSNENKKRATFLLTWFWGLTASTVVSALLNHCQKHHLNPEDTYVWQCALCNNQFRIEETKAKGTHEEFEPFRAMFNSRVTEIGGIVALISPWHNPHILRRVWCNYEIFIACKKDSGISFAVTLPTSDEEDFARALATDGMGTVLDAYKSVKIQESTATTRVDVLKIMEIIDGSVTDAAAKEPTKIEASPRPCYSAGYGFKHSLACNKLNAEVVRKLQEQLVNAGKDGVKKMLENRDPAALPASGALMELLTNICNFDRAEELFEQVSQIAQNSSFGNAREDAIQYASLLCLRGNCMGDQGDQDAASNLYDQSYEIFVNSRAEDTQEFASLLSSIATGLRYKSFRMSEHASAECLREAWAKFQRGKGIFERAQATCTVEYANLLKRMGNVRNSQGYNDEGFDLLQQAKIAYQYGGHTHSVDYVGLLTVLAEHHIDLDERLDASHYDDASHNVDPADRRAATALIEEGKSVCSAIGATDTLIHGMCFRMLGDLEFKDGNFDAAITHYEAAKQTFEAASTTSNVQYDYVTYRLSMLEQRRHVSPVDIRSFMR